MDMRASRTVLLLLAAAGIVQILHYYPSMPERMASHFDGSGRPDGFQSRDAFFALSAGMLAMTVVTFGGLGALFRRIPSKWFNLPNRDYWLAPQRREETIESISSQLEWLGAASLALYVFVIQMVAETNRTSEPRLDSGSMFLVLGLFLAYTTIWIVRFVTRFRKPRPDAA
jgi:serine/threonine-protein kinase